MFSLFCSKVAPIPSLLAPHLIFVSISTSKCVFFTMFAICILKFENVFLCLSSHFSLLDDVVFSFLSNWPNGSYISARFGMSLVRWCMIPKNDLNCFSVLDGSSFSSASVFVISGVTPCGVILNPSHSIVGLANSHFCKLIARPSLFSQSSFVSRLSSCSFSIHFVAIRMSSRNAK